MAVLYVSVFALLVALFLFYLIYSFLKNPMLVIANSIFGFIILLLLDMIFGFGIPIDFWSIATVAIGGLGGVMLILILHFLGIGF